MKQQSLQELKQLQTNLAEFERQYGMASADFYRQYQDGEIGDDMDFVEWASLVQMTNNLKNESTSL